MYFYGIILDCVNKINENRTISGIYHLLTGKKSIQSVHDARIFHLEQYYGVYKSLSKSDYTTVIKEMINTGLIEIAHVKEHYRLTERGKNHLQECMEDSFFTYFNGLSFDGKSLTFIERLYLLVQTLSNTRVNHYSFIPVVDNPSVTRWVSLLYKQIKSTDVNVSFMLYEELHDLLEQLKDREAEFFTDRLTGYKYYGLSTDQLSQKFQLTKHDAILYQTAITHRIIALIENNHQKYKMMNLLIKDSKKHTFITKTANDTYQLLKKNIGIAEIARIRKLKINTIYDHIVEITLYDNNFVIDSLVSKAEQLEIIEAIKLNNTYKLKRIKDSCNSSISYFQIRLTLARLNELLIGDETYV